MKPPYLGGLVLASARNSDLPVSVDYSLVGNSDLPVSVEYVAQIKHLPCPPNLIKFRLY